MWRFLKKLEIELLYDPAIPLLGIHTKETRSERVTCTPMFIAALFIIARSWKQPRCPSADEWIRKLWYIYTMEYYSAIKKNSFESVLMRWMKLEPIIQSEVSPAFLIPSLARGFSLAPQSHGESCKNIVNIGSTTRILISSQNVNKVCK